MTAVPLPLNTRNNFVPSREDMVRLVEDAGSGDAGYFHYPVKEDGLYLQQDPEEFAAFVHYMATKVPPARLSLDIGIASGGQTKFLRDYYRCDKTIVVDIGQHPLFPHWARIKKDLKSDLVLEIISDSHAPAVREQLLPYAGQVDFAFVDGDHSYRGLRQDIFLTKELMRVGAFMVLHDTSAVADCRRVYDELLDSSSFVLVRNFNTRFGISVWQYINDKRKPSGFNRRTGWGKL